MRRLSWPPPKRPISAARSPRTKSAIGAYGHARQAVRLAPDNSRYRSGAGKLARILGDYQIAKDDSEQALAIDLKAYGEDHPDVARDCRSLEKLGMHSENTIRPSTSAQKFS